MFIKNLQEILKCLKKKQLMFWHLSFLWRFTFLNPLQLHTTWHHFFCAFSDNDHAVVTQHTTVHYTESHRYEQTTHTHAHWQKESQQIQLLTRTDPHPLNSTSCPLPAESSQPTYIHKYKCTQTTHEVLVKVLHSWVYAKHQHCIPWVHWNYVVAISTWVLETNRTPAPSGWPWYTYAGAKHQPRLLYTTHATRHTRPHPLQLTPSSLSHLCKASSVMYSSEWPDWSDPFVAYFSNLFLVLLKNSDSSS